MNREIIIDSYGLGHAVAVLQKGEIIDCFIDPPKNAGFYPPNTFLRAKIDRKVPNIGGYFVKLPNGKQGLLKSKNNYEEGKTILLQSQVINEEQKSQTFSDNLKIISKYFIIKIRKKGYSFSKKIPKNYDRFNASKLLHSRLKGCKDIFVICRSSIADISSSDFDKELEKAIKNYKIIEEALAGRDVYYDGLARKVSLEKYRNEFSKISEETGIFESMGIWDQLEKLIEGKVQLYKGSYLIFEQTSAFLNIDLNSGNNLKFKKNDINLNACDEIFRVITLCGFGGKILIDFLPSSGEARKEIYKKMSLCFSGDTVKNKIWGWTKSGIFELERKRDKIPLKLLIANN